MFNLNIGPSPREREKEEGKCEKQPTPSLTAGAVGPCPTIIQISRTPGTESVISITASSDHPLDINEHSSQWESTLKEQISFI